MMKRRFRAWEHTSQAGRRGAALRGHTRQVDAAVVGRQGLATRMPGDLEMILGWVQSGRDIAMIVVDTLATSVDGIDENQAKDINPVMKFLDGWRRCSGPRWCSSITSTRDRGRRGTRHVALKGSFVYRRLGQGRGDADAGQQGERRSPTTGGRAGTWWRSIVAKANDDRARYVACYYELLTEDIEVGDAVDPERVGMQPTPVLVPVHRVRVAGIWRYGRVFRGASGRSRGQTGSSYKTG